MERLTKFGYVWKHKKTGKLYGAKIDVKTIEELKEYEQVPRNTKEKQLEPEALFAPTKSRRTENA